MSQKLAMLKQNDPVKILTEWVKFCKENSIKTSVKWNYKKCIIGDYIKVFVQVKIKCDHIKETFFFTKIGKSYFDVIN